MLSTPIKLLLAPVMLPISILNLLTKILGLLFAPIFLFVGVMLKLILGIIRLILVPIAVALIVSFVVSSMRMLIKRYQFDKHHRKKIGCLFEGFSRKKHKSKKETIRVEIKDTEGTKVEETKKQAAVEKAPEQMKERDYTKGGSTGAGL